MRMILRNVMAALVCYGTGQCDVGRCNPKTEVPLYCKYLRLLLYSL